MIKLGFLSDFKNIIEIFPSLDIPEFSRSRHRHPCSKEWFIDVKEAIENSTENSKKSEFKQAIESTKRLIDYLPSEKCLMLALLEITQARNKYEITKQSWEFLFSRNQSSIISLVKEISSLSIAEIRSRNYPFKKNTDKISVLNSIKRHILFYRDNKKSYEVYGNYYSLENLSLFNSFFNSLKNFCKTPIENMQSEKLKQIETITHRITSYSILTIESEREKLGNQVSGLPAWEGDNLDRLMKQIDETATCKLDSISESLIFPQTRRNPKNRYGLCMDTSLFRKILSIMKDNYHQIGDYSPALQDFLEKLEEHLKNNRNRDFIIELKKCNYSICKFHGLTERMKKEGAKMLMEGAEAFEIFSNELESAGEFIISKSWIDPETNRGKISVHEKAILEIELKKNSFVKEKTDLENKIKDLEKEYNLIKSQIEDIEKRKASIKIEVKEAYEKSQFPLSFLERFLRFLGFNYISKKRKTYFEQLKDAQHSILGLGVAGKELEKDKTKNRENLSNSSNKLRDVEIQIVSLEKEIKEIEIDLQKEKNRVQEARNHAAILKSTAGNLAPGISYKATGAPWRNGLPTQLQDCKKTGEDMAKKVKSWIMKNAGDQYEKSVEDYVKTGEDLLKFLVTVQAFSTIYLNSLSSPSSSFLLFTTQKRAEIIRELDKKINSDRSHLADLLTSSKGSAEKMCLCLKDLTD